jgi:two-component system, response regulator
LNGFSTKGGQVNQIILLVEDNRDDEALTLRALRNLLPLQIVVTAHDGAEALDYLFGTGDYLGRNPAIIPKIVLLDLRLPRVSGLEVLRRIREDTRTRALPVIVLTASHREEDILDSYDCGANSYICKTIDYSQHCDNMKQIVTYWLALCELPASTMHDAG